jgi:uncharacterized protein with FMN-binding domain
VARNQRQRLHPGLVALSASAIAAVYAVGYLHTQPYDAALAAAASNTPVVAIATPLSAASASPRPVASPTVAPVAAAAQQGYTDGTYTGSGTSRFGGVEVQVTVQAGKITNVALTRVTTKYPASRIAALPGQVVSRQTAQVDNVSGATASASAFRMAVQTALRKAA